MANEIFKEIKTRIALKTLDLAGWETIKETYKPLKGEVCICEIPTSGTVPPAGSVTPPTILFKVGDGVNFWKDLNWASALAADVYEWAKQDKLITVAAAGAEGQGNAITSIEWGANLNGGKGGLLLKKQTTFATKAELDAAVEAFGGDLSAITDNDHVYTFSVPETGDHAGQLMVIAEHKVNGATSSTETKYFDFVTPGELTAILDSYYTKTEVDELLQDIRDNIPTELGVMSVELLAGTTNGSLKLKVNDVEGDDVVVTGLEEIKVKNATHADAAGKVDTAITVKVGGADVVFDGSEVKTADVDAAIAAAIDAIPDVVHPEYSIVKDATSDYAATYHLTKDGVNVGAAINIPKDMVVEHGEVKELEAGVWGEAGTYIVITLANATDDKLYINVGTLIEYVTSGSATGDMVYVTVDPVTHKITATITDGTITEAKLHADVTTKLNKVWDAEGAAATAEQNAKDYADGLVENYGDIVTHNAAEFATNAENGAKALADQNKLAIDAINHAETGILAQAKEDAADKAAVVLSEAQTYADGKVAALAGEGNTTTVAALAERVDGLETAGHLTEVVANDTAEKHSGLKVTDNNKIEIDDEVIFVLDCNW